MLIFNICAIWWWIIAESFYDQFLADVGLYESQEEAVSREEVLGRLDQVDLSMGFSLMIFSFFVIVML